MLNMNFLFQNFQKVTEIVYLKNYTRNYASLYIPNWLFVVEYCVSEEKLHKDQAYLFSLL